MPGPDEDRGDGAEIALWQAFRAEGSVAAREKLFTRHAAFARNIARRHHRQRSYGDIEMADLQQLAYAGLLEALDRYDPALGTPFRPFAAHRISGSVRDGIVRMSEMREQMSWQHRARRERLKSLAGEDTSQLGTSEAMAKLAEIAVGLALGFMLEGTGLFATAEDTGADPASPASSAYESLAWKETVVQLQAELSLLPEREQTILRRHYLDGLDFDQLASLLAISKGRVSQLHRAALLLLRKRMGQRGHFRLRR